MKTKKNNDPREVFFWNRKIKMCNFIVRWVFLGFSKCINILYCLGNNTEFLNTYFCYFAGLVRPSTTWFHFGMDHPLYSSRPSCIYIYFFIEYPFLLVNTEVKFIANAVSKWRIGQFAGSEWFLLVWWSNWWTSKPILLNSKLFLVKLFDHDSDGGLDS